LSGRTFLAVRHSACRTASQRTQLFVLKTQVKHLHVEATCKHQLIVMPFPFLHLGIHSEANPEVGLDVLPTGFLPIKPCFCAYNSEPTGSSAGNSCTGSLSSSVVACPASSCLAILSPCNCAFIVKSFSFCSSSGCGSFAITALRRFLRIRSQNASAPRATTASGPTTAPAIQGGVVVLECVFVGDELEEVDATYSTMISSRNLGGGGVSGRADM